MARHLIAALQVLSEIYVETHAYEFFLTNSKELRRSEWSPACIL